MTRLQQFMREAGGASLKVDRCDVRLTGCAAPSFAGLESAFLFHLAAAFTLT